MTARDPRPGDRVLIRGTVTRGGASWQDDGVNVTIGGDHPMVVRVPVSQVVEVLDPEWFPPRHRDLVIDRDGTGWQLVHVQPADDVLLRWRCAVDDYHVDTAQLLADFGPLTLVGRGGKPVDR